MDHCCVDIVMILSARTTAMRFTREAYFEDIYLYIFYSFALHNKRSDRTLTHFRFVQPGLGMENIISLCKIARESN